MRAYTTLLSHILGTHPEISGYSEINISYRNAFDLLKLRCMVYRAGNYKPRCSYVLDKILHSKFLLSDSILRRDDLRVLFVIREPLETIKSMVAMHRDVRLQGGEPAHIVPGTVNDALRHYNNRLSMLVAIGERLHSLGKNALVIGAEEVVRKPQTTLNTIGNFLSLDNPLHENYSVFDFTGRQGSGDPSKFIGTGRIERKRDSHSEISVSGAVRDEANRTHRRCLTRLLELFPRTR